MLQKSLLAILLGFLTAGLLCLGTHALFGLLGLFPPLGEQISIGFSDPLMLWTSLAYHTLYGMVGGYITARYARFRVFAISLLASTRLVANILVSVLLRQHYPAWYLLLVILVSFPAVWIGGLERSSIR